MNHEEMMEETMTREGYEQLMSRLAELEEKLAQLRLYKGTEAIEAGDHWHDNPTLYMTEMQERALMRQIAILRERTRKAKIVEAAAETETVGLGSVVDLRFEDGSVERFRLLGSADGDPAEGTISSLSPLGKAILGATAGETREYHVGSTVHKVVVLAISPCSSEL